jgi:hypothetical protein
MIIDISLIIIENCPCEIMVRGRRMSRYHGVGRWGMRLQVYPRQRNLILKEMRNYWGGAGRCGRCGRYDEILSEDVRGFDQLILIRMRE